MSAPSAGPPGEGPMKIEQEKPAASNAMRVEEKGKKKRRRKDKDANNNNGTGSGPAAVQTNSLALLPTPHTRGPQLLVSNAPLSASSLSTASAPSSGLESGSM